MAIRVLITGICGFVGSTLARSLLRREEGLQIMGIDNLGRAGSESNRRLLQRLGMQVLHGDVRMASDVDALPACDWVIDAAANPSVLAGKDGRSSSRQLVEHNLLGTLQLAEYCRRHQAGMILLSSSRVYSIAALTALPLEIRGNAYSLDLREALPPGVGEGGLSEDFSRDPPISLYGSTKLASEVMCLEYAEAFGFPVWVNRCGVLAGPGQFGTAEQGIFSYWLHAHAQRRRLRYIGFEGKGRQVRDAFHPDDLAQLIWRQMKTPSRGGRRVFNIGGGAGNAMSLADLTAWCDERFGKHSPEPDTAPRPYDIPWLVMDAGVAHRQFGWSVQRRLPAILDEIALHVEQNPDWLERCGV